MPDVPQITATGSDRMAFFPAASPASFGAQLGGSLIQAGEQWTHIANRLQQQANQLDAASAINRWTLRVADAYDAILRDNTLRGRTLDETQAMKVRELETVSRAIRREIGEGLPDLVLQEFMGYELRRMAEMAVHMRHDVLRQELDRQHVLFATMARQEAARAALDPSREQSFFGLLSTQQKLAEEQGIIPQSIIVREVEAARDVFWRQKAISDPMRILEIQRDMQEGKTPPAGMDPTRMRDYAHLAQLTLQGQEAELQRMQKLLDQQHKEQLEAIRNDFVAKWANNTLTTQEILASDLPPTGEGSKEHFIKLMAAKAKEGDSFRRDSRLMGETFSDIRTFKIRSMRELEDLYIKSQERGHGISYEDFQHLAKEFTDMRAPDGRQLAKVKEELLRAVKPSIDRSIIGQSIDPIGALKYVEFEDFVARQIDAFRQAGKDIFQLFDPSSPDYLGRPSVIRRFQHTLRDEIEHKRQQLRQDLTPDDVPKRLPGESYDAYRKRTLGK